MYSVKEIFYSLQGEGFHAGRPAVFCRFSGCNLWSGREEDRQTAACTFCDTDFVGTDGVGGGKFHSAQDLADRISSFWPMSHGSGRRFVVFTGGEPLLQLDDELIGALKNAGYETAVETNGTRAAPTSLDWICVSPKVGNEFVQTSGQELKLVYPHPTLVPDQFVHLDFDHFYLQPLDGPNKDRNLTAAIDYCLANPQWHLSLQTHKLSGIR